MSNFVDEDIYQNILRNFDQNYNNSKLIALTLRDIFMNDIVYISHSREWKLYKSKKWQPLDKNGMKRKISKLSTILCQMIEKVIDVDIENEKKKEFISKIMKLNKILCTESYDYDRVESECIPLFTVDLRTKT